MRSCGYLKSEGAKILKFNSTAKIRRTADFKPANSSSKKIKKEQTNEKDLNVFIISPACPHMPKF
jgi:hypothetical protein